MVLHENYALNLSEKKSFFSESTTFELPFVELLYLLKLII